MRRPVSESHQLHSGVYMDWWIDSCHFKERVRRIWQFWLYSLNALWHCHALSLQFDGHSCLTTETRTMVFLAIQFYPCFSP